MNRESPTLQSTGESLSPLSPRAEQALDTQFDHLRRELSLVAAPPALEGKLAAAFAAHHRRQAGAARWRARLGEVFAPGVAVAASLGMAAWMMLAPVAPMLQSPAAPVASLGDDTPFIALASLERIALEPKPRVVQTTVPRMMLASYGVAVSPEVAGENMRAEVLMSAAGQPLAMRFIP
ncbi:MAG: hypothetical protein JNK75_05515 [Betaproteobacteria bacterium]|nr:hypothetical protein [Betaproteobacteria bacterium]